MVPARPGDALAHLWLGAALLAMQAEPRRFEITRSPRAPFMYSGDAADGLMP